jgi:AraC-like DNA-binding protein
MSEHHHAHPQDFSDTLKSFDGEAAAYRRVFDALNQQFGSAQAMLVSTFPRGGTQILQPSHVPEEFLRQYSKGLFTADGPTWQAVQKNRPVTGNECVPSGTLEESSFYKQLMQPNNLGHVLAVRVPGPVFDGYPAALHLYREASERPFTGEDVKRIAPLAEDLGHAIQRAREARTHHACGERPAWERGDFGRQFIFDRHGRQATIYDRKASVDDQLRQAIKELVEQRLEHVNGDSVVSDRVELTDSRGEVWAFRAIVHREFPALGDGPYVFLCLPPAACEWNAVRPGDFTADAEVARLVPTLKFMQQEFHRSPTLDEISAKAHLSPFHFHRRFTELLGQTPKHFLLACQIEQAKRMLMERKVALAEIAAECGFAHQSHFTSRFKQATGLTPTRWRRFASEMASEEVPAGQTA